MDALNIALVPYVLRWSHIIFGIMWLGHLYFFNLVNVPFQAGLDKDVKAKVNPALLLRAFYWFRWSAMYTLILGLALFVWHYIIEGAMKSPDGRMTDRAMWIQFGMTLGIIMWFNVWFVIWPRQKKILGGLVAGTPHPDAAKMAAVSGKASRFNTYASGPMLFGMIGATHFGAMSAPVLLIVSVIGVGFWFGMIKRSFKVKTTV
ncbi:MAG TPA: urate hydroxylase PuuD [Polyangia bacterium]|nr:urate hydroxylase PuuD [Polyangia bacterium]